MIGIAESDRGRGLQHEGIYPSAAIDRILSTAIGDGVVTGAAGDDVSAATAVDCIVAGAASQYVDAGRSDNRDRLRGRQLRCINVLKF